MKLPNGYGSVIKLGKNRRKPFAVRISDGNRKNSKGEYVQKYKYLSYHEKSKDAYAYLAQYNAGQTVKEHASLIKQPTFEEVYKLWFEYRQSMNKKIGDSSIRSYTYGYGLCEDLHKKKMINISIDDLQTVANKYKGMSKGVAGNIKKIYSAIYEYSIKRSWVNEDYSKMIDYEYSSEKRIIHTDFKAEEIMLLWDRLDVKHVDWILIMIYMGWRASEFCNIETKNVHIEDNYIVGGMKTEAGRERIVPIHSKIIPLIKKYYNQENKYLFYNDTGSKMIYKTLLIYWTELMNVLGMSHLPHDTRYTTATLLDNFGANRVCIKKILGHSSKDITDGTYIQKDISELIKAIELIIL